MSSAKGRCAASRGGISAKPQRRTSARTALRVAAAQGQHTGAIGVRLGQGFSQASSGETYRPRSAARELGDARA
eukprot:6877225-Alexandrium_andersonii.AAC.1